VGKLSNEGKRGIECFSPRGVKFEKIACSKGVEMRGGKNKTGRRAGRSLTLSQEAVRHFYFWRK